MRMLHVHNGPHSPFRQTFELGIFTSTGKSNPKFSKTAKFGCKTLQPCEVCKFCILLYYAWKSVITFRNLITHFRALYKSIQNSQTLQDFIFHILLHNFTKYRMLFSAVLMNIPNSKVCLKGEWSTSLCTERLRSVNRLVHNLHNAYFIIPSPPSVNSPANNSCQ